MVGDAAEGLQDDEGSHALPGPLDDLGRDQDPLSRIIGMGDDGVAGLRDVAELLGGLEQGVLFRHGGHKVVRHVEDPLDQVQEGPLRNGFFHSEFLRLGPADKVGLLDDVRHLGLDDLKAVFLQIELDIVIGARVEIEQVLSHDQDLGPGPGPVVGNVLHEPDRLLEALLHAADAAVLNALHDRVDGPVEGPLRAAGLLFIGPDLAQQVLEGIDHGQGEGDLDGGLEVELEAGMEVVVVHIVIGDDRHVLMARVVQGLAQKGPVVGQTAAADVLAHHDGLFPALVSGVLQGLQGLADDHLGREADVVVHIALAQLDRALPPDGKGHGLQSLRGKDRRHEPAEGVGGIGDKDD